MLEFYFKLGLRIVGELAGIVICKQIVDMLQASGVSYGFIQYFLKCPSAGPTGRNGIIGG